jgi:hypothetical protein
MGAYTVEAAVFAPAELERLRRRIVASPQFAVNTLNRDFVGTRGFSIVFRREGLPRVERDFPFFKPYLDRVLRDDCNAFYMNPLALVGGSRVDPHIDRSLSGYYPEVNPPLLVTVLYVEVPPAMRGGALVLRRGKKHLGKIVPVQGSLVAFDGDLMHSVDRVESEGSRLSLVCEQYRLTDDELEKIPEFTVESRSFQY